MEGESAFSPLALRRADWFDGFMSPCHLSKGAKETVKMLGAIVRRILTMLSFFHEGNWVPLHGREKPEVR